MSLLGPTEFEEFLQHPERFIIRPETDFPIIAATETELLPLDPRRVGWRIINRDVRDLAWAFQHGLTAANGDIIQAVNGAANANWWQDREVCTFPVFALGNGGTVQVRRTQFLLQGK